MFTVYSSKGFTVTFENGLEVSVMLGTENYCENRGMEVGHYTATSRDAEVAVFKHHKMITTPFTPDESNPVVGWQNPLDVLTILEWASRQ